MNGGKEEGAKWGGGGGGRKKKKVGWGGENGRAVYGRIFSKEKRKGKMRKRKQRDESVLKQDKNSF